MGPNPPAVTSEVSEVSEVRASLPHRFPFVEGLSEYEEEKREGTMAKAVVVQWVSTNWRINGVADCAGKIIGEVIGVRWLFFFFFLNQ